MFLYELAVELNEHSGDLVEVAAMLGVANAGPGSNLDAQQVAQLRAHFGGLPAGPPPPPLPMPGSQAPPPSAGPSAPGEWGPPAPPPAWGPPGTPTFEAAPGPPLGSSFPGAPAPGPVQGSPDPADGGLSNGQKGALGAVAAVVVALFGFMMLNVGPDEERQQALEARERELAASTTEWVPPPEASSTTEAPMVTAAPMPRAVPGGISSGEAGAGDPDNKPPAPDDVTRFCSGVRAIMDLENGVAEAFLDDDVAAMQASLAASRGDWNIGVDHMMAGASDRDRPLIERYRSNYLAMFGAIERASSPGEVTDYLHANYTQAELDIADPVNSTARAYCR